MVEYKGIVRDEFPDWIGWEIIDQLDKTKHNSTRKHRDEIRRQLNYEVRLLKYQIEHSK